MGVDEDIVNHAREIICPECLLMILTKALSQDVPVKREGKYS